jgi:hypothetical protein
MGIIREPNGVDFVIDSSSMTDTDRKKISEIIKNLKATKNLYKNAIKTKKRDSKSKINIV